VPEKIAENDVAAARRYYNFRRREAARRSRPRLIAHYGGACACCGETAAAFLDVVDLRDSAPRDRERQLRLYAFLARPRPAGPPPGFQVLCANCNHARGRHGSCPHQTGRVHGPDPSLYGVLVGPADEVPDGPSR
jgi:hypothetical protein